MKSRMPFSAVVILVFFLLFCPFNFQAYAAEQVDNVSPDTAEQCHISYTLSTRRPSVVDYDATNEYVFFAYSENLAVVDAYNMSGEFVFSILFEFREKGSISIRCENNLLYVSTKFGNVFVFDHDQLLEVIESSAATEKGYGWKWFEGKQRNVSLIGINLYKLNQTGDIGRSIPIPFNVIWGIYSAYSLIVAIVFALCVMLFRPKRRTNKRTLY